MLKTNFSNTPNGVGATIIAMMNQKGGVGKSTITTLLANVFFFQHHLRVAIIDADFPQLTIFKRRKNSLNYIKNYPPVLDTFNSIYSSSEPLSVYHANPQTVAPTIQKIRQQYDLIFIDLAGTINQQALVELLPMVQHFFIPVLQDDDTIQSSLEFYKYLQLATQADHSTLHLFFNRIPHQNIVANYKRSLEGQFYILENDMPAYTAYERELRSTLFPIQANDKKFQKPVQRLFAFTDEIHTIISKSLSTSSEHHSDTEIQTKTDNTLSEYAA